MRLLRNHLQRQDHLLEAVQDLREAPSRVLSGSLVTLDRGGQEGAGAGAVEGRQDDHQLKETDYVLTLP